MGAWLSGIVGIISLGLLLEIVLPEGQTTKYVRGAFSLLVILAVVAPLPKLFGGELSFVFDGVDYSSDTAYLFQVTRDYEESVEDCIERALLSEGYTARAKVIAEDVNFKRLQNVQVNLTFSGIDGDDVNTHISRVKSLVAALLGVSEDKVEVEHGSG